MSRPAERSERDRLAAWHDRQELRHHEEAERQRRLCFTGRDADQLARIERRISERLRGR